MATLQQTLSRHSSRAHTRADQPSLDNPPFLDEDGHVAFGPGDPENPQNWSTPKRWWVTICAVSLVMNATFASSTPSGCFGSISKSFHVSQEAAGLTITVFLLGYCAGPLLFAPLSEFFGRKWIFYITFSLYIIFNFLCAFAPNFGSLLVGRFLTGTVSAYLKPGFCQNFVLGVRSVDMLSSYPLRYPMLLVSLPMSGVPWREATPWQHFRPWCTSVRLLGLLLLAFWTLRRIGGGHSMFCYG